jgi:hypothetical protein
MNSEKGLAELIVETILNHREKLPVQPVPAVTRESINTTSEGRMVLVLPVIAVADDPARGVWELTSPLSDG